MVLNQTTVLTRIGIHEKQTYPRTKNPSPMAMIFDGYYSDSNGTNHPQPSVRT